jgi:hypothetical protein
MKKLSVLLVFCFLLSSIGISTVSAQDLQTGYIPLLTPGYDTTIPRAELSHQQFQLLLPELMEAKQKGEIASFEPDYFAGFVKVTYSSDSIAGNGISPLAVGDPQQAFVPVPSNPGSDNSVSPVSTYAPKITIHLYSSCVDMSVLGAGSHVQGTLKTSSRVIANLDGFADSNGNLSTCFASNVIPGYVVNFKIYTPGGSLLKTVTGTAPRFSITKFDMPNAVVSGTAAAGKALDFFWSHPNFDAANTYLAVSKSATASSTGKWSVDLGSQAMRGNDFLALTQTVNSNLVAENDFWSPSLSCILGSNFCILAAIPNSQVSLIITHAGVTHTLTGKADNSGNFYGYLVDGNQEPIFLSVGDSISGTGAIAFKLVNLTAAPHPSTGIITGVAPANNYLAVSFQPLGAATWNNKWVHSDSAGNYSANFSSVGIPTGPINYSVNYISKATGDQTFLRYKTDL